MGSSHLAETLTVVLFTALALLLASVAARDFGWPVERGLLVECIGLLISIRFLNGRKKNGNGGNGQ